MIKTFKRFMTGLTAALSMPALVLVPIASAANSTVTVTGSGQSGWLFNRDLSTSTPYEFNTNEASIGAGSLYVKPITNTTAANAPENKDKFVAEQFLKTPVADVDSISYDFKIAGVTGDSTDAKQFYLNVYANIDNTDKFYDCRYDYAPSVGLTTAFTTATVTPATTPTDIKLSGTRIASCPPTLAQMPAGSEIRAFAINVGDTSASDTGLAGYLDKVVVNANDNMTTYDFEPTIKVASKDDCKNEGWMTSNTPVFKNQGDCVSSFASQNKAKSNPVTNFLRNL